MKSSKTIINEYLHKTDWRVKENSNSIYSFGSLNKYITSEVSKDYWLNEVYPENVAMAYVDGHIHIHDLGGLSLYCCGYSLKDILLKGLRGVPNIPTSDPPKHFDSALNQLANLITVFQNEILGAVAFNGFDTLLAPFIKNDNLSYLDVKQSMQNFIFSINSNSRGGAEPAFSNITFDLTPPKDMLNEYAVIGGDLVSFTYGSCQKEMDMLNRVFYEIMLNGDADGKLFAYPIPTYNIHDRFDWDNPNNRLLWEMAGKYGTPYFANFVNSDLDISDVRSMCPLGCDTKILYWSDYHKKFYVSPIRNLYDSMQKSGRETVKVLCCGKEIECKINRFEEPATYKITLANGATVTTTGNHLNMALNKNYVQTKDLTTEDYLPVSENVYEKTKNMSYEDGKLIGMFLGDGSYIDDYAVTFSLNRSSKQPLVDFVYDQTLKRFGATIREDKCVSDISGKQSCTNICVYSKMLNAMIRQFVTGDNALTKGIDGLAYAQSVQFRQGILDGLYATDGGNSNRIYTSSETLKNDITTLCATLGIATNIDKDNREGRLGNNTCYTVRFYERTNKKHYENVYIRKNGMMWFRIVNIEQVKPTSKYSYCFEVCDDNAEPIYMLANGILTHNCRLSLNLKELRHRNGGLFGAGDSTGSIGVVTLNLPRIGYESKTEDELYSAIDKYLEIMKESLEIKRAWLQKNVIDTKLIPAYCEYVGTIDNHFSTIGIVGGNEMCENFLGKNILSDEGKQLMHNVSQHIREKLIQFQEETGHLYNYEATPAEATCYRLARIDKAKYPDIITQGSGKDVYYTNSCHIPVKLISSINETFKHQEPLQKQFTGGTVIHCFLEGAISGDEAKSIVKATVTNYGVPYMSISPISRYCPTHGYVKEVVDKCPICKEKVSKYQRITGYLRCIDNFNPGKRAEFEDRVQLKGDTL